MSRFLARFTSFLAVCLVAFAGATATSAPASAAVPTPKQALAYTPAELENQIITLTNQRRAAAGCGAVVANSYLRLAARRHSNLMGKYQTMSHQLSGEATLGKRITAAGYTNWLRVGENIATGFSSASITMNAWMNSETHRRNIVDCTFRHIGVGVVYLNGRYWWTQDFGRR